MLCSKAAGVLCSVEIAFFCVLFSTKSVDDILLLLTFICSLVSSVHDIMEEELEELKVCSVL